MTMAEHFSKSFWHSLLFHQNENEKHKKILNVMLQMNLGKHFMEAE
jgi:hypothetical protein